jgi:hypothetical protein
LIPEDCLVSYTDGTTYAPASLPAAGTLPSAAPSQARPLRALLRSFRRNFLDQQDPFVCAGEPLDEFTFSGSYELPLHESAQEIADEIRAAIHDSLSNGNLARAELDVIDFSDALMQHEAPRRFIVTRTTTPRRTPITIYAYFQPYGQHLFYSVRSYAVPSLNGWKLLAALVVGFMGFGPLFGLVGMLLALKPGMGIFLLLVIGAGVTFVCRKFIRNITSGDSVSIALRKQFPGAMTIGSYDDDDVIAFLKTNIALTLGTIAKVLEKHGVETGTLRQVVQNLHTINIDTGGGGIVGAVFGGSGNSAIGQMLK